MSTTLFTIDDRRVKRFEEDLRRAKDDYERELAKFNEQAATNFAYALEWQADYVLTAQARYEVAANLLDGDAPLDMVEVSRWLASALNRLQHARTGDSGSTSTLTNVKMLTEQAVTLRYIGMLIG